MSDGLRDAFGAASGIWFDPANVNKQTVTSPDDLTSDPWDGEDLADLMKELNNSWKPKECECGAKKANTTHADWCPLFVEYGVQ